MTYSRPGVYINETLLPAPIATTASTVSAGAVVAQFAQGPLSVVRVNSWYDFITLFGSYNVSYPATFGVAEFFANGGSELYVRRVLGSGAAAATASVVNNGTVELAKITALSYGSDGTNLTVQFSPTATSGKFNLVVSKEINGNVTVLEQYYNITFDPSSPTFIEAVVNSSSKFISVEDQGLQGTPVTTIIPFTGSGLDGSAIAALDYTSALPEFEILTQPLVLFSPELHNSFDANSAIPSNVHAGFIDWAADKDVFVVLDTAPKLTVNEALLYANTSGFTSSQAAVYYPYIYIQDPLSKNLRKIGPAGSVAGLFISNDKQYGPFKAPSGLRSNIKNALSTEKQFTNADLDALNSGSYVDGTTPKLGGVVNAIRNVPGAGVVVMGARTLLQDGTSNRYVSMRRSLIYIKKNIRDIGNSALFENNGPVLWSRLRTSISAFLNQYRNQGGLAGATPAQAFYVKIDSENNTTQTIANGEVHIEVGVALEYPAEFVVINLTQLVSQ